jgi:hypothetical protein
MSEFSIILYSPEVLEFVKSSQDFCKWLEDGETRDGKRFIHEGLGILARLYSWMIIIPGTDPVFNESLEKFVSEEDWSRIYKNTEAILGPGNDYSDIPNVNEFDRSDVITRKISEDISDIYQDIRDFLEVFRNSPEEIMNDALWECKTTFENSWGEKILRILRAMHNNYFNADSQEDNSIIKNKSDNSLKNVDTSNWFISKRQKEIGYEE